MVRPPGSFQPFELSITGNKAVFPGRLDAHMPSYRRVLEMMLSSLLTRNVNRVVADVKLSSSTAVIVIVHFKAGTELP